MGRRERESKKKRKERKDRKHKDKDKKELRRIGEWSAGWLEPMVGVAGRTLAFFEPSEGVAGLFHELAGDPPLTVVSEFHAACVNPIFGPPRRPQRVRTSDESVATRLREVSNLTVIVGPTPELAAFQAAVRKELARGKRNPAATEGALRDGALDEDAGAAGEDELEEDELDAGDTELLLPADLPDAVSKRFYSAAAALDASSLWSCVRDGKFMEVRVSGLEEVRPKFVLPLHGDGEPQAVLVLDRREDVDAYEREYWGELVMPMASLMMLYEPIEELTEAGRRRLDAWQPSGHDSDAFMSLRRFAPGDGPPEPPTERDVRFATAILRGLRALFESHGEALARPRDQSMTLRVEVPELGAAGAEPGGSPFLEFTLPSWDGTPASYADVAIDDEDRDDDWDDEEEEETVFDPDLEAALTRLATAGRNAPCPCGSQKKYKKCHFLEDQSRRHGLGPASQGRSLSRAL